MWDWLGTASYMAHGFCLLWQPWLVVLYAGSDALIFFAYSAIPIALLRFIRLRPDFGYSRLLALFAAFILLCGLTHLISIVTLWYPVYAIHGIAKLVTGAVSLLTAAVLFPLVPVVARLPSPSALRAANEQLLAEAAAHERTMAKLREAQAGLEVRVAERTAALRATNRQLDIAGREAVHRAKNIFAVVASLVRQTAHNADDVEDLTRRLLGRIDALARATDAILPASSGGGVDFATIAERQLAPYIDAYGDRIALTCDMSPLRADQAQQVALALHELATNAVKYGALSGDAGTVGINWSQPANGTVRLQWKETGLPEVPDDGVQTPGFGTMLLLKAIPAQLAGEAVRRIEDGTLSYDLVFPAV